MSLYMEQSEEIYANVDRKSYGQDIVNWSIDKQPESQNTESDNSGKRSSRVAAACLGLLCVLLAGIIGQSVYYDGVSKSFLAYKTNSSAEIEQLQTSNNTLTKERDQLQTSYNTLTKERDQLQTSYNTLTKERDQLQTSNNTLTKEKDKLQTSYNTLTKERDQLQSSYNTLTKERDQLQTSYNTLTKERAKLQTERDFLSRRLTNLSWQKFESSWYFLSTESKTWKESREDCLKRGADLVIINSDKEQTFLFNLKKRVWIGLTDSVNEGTWKWVDDTPLTTRYWYAKQPDNAGPNGEEDCAEIHKDQSPLKAWNDMSCGSKLNWVCEKVF
ncbi:C-type lectin domain family 4 member M-like isoform X2 [Salmo trutta]|uniref:C-type lectin domain family 4 member M-like isoform X2 n=1 Tax=Salmo trutta TaxID=8032 RepID=UPI00113185F8|nr:C-type lectin domain family 4 member M-like isoform X2 [Salmo trutta]